jgi:hypothetical protein
MSTIEFGSGLRARLANNAHDGAREAPVDLRPFYELLRTEALVFRSFSRRRRGSGAGAADRLRVGIRPARLEPAERQGP